MSHPLQQDLDHILEHTHGHWESARNARLFITGGTGFFGTWLLESLAWANKNLGLDAHATVLSRRPVQFIERHPHLDNDPTFEFIQGDVRDFTFPPGHYTHVIHAASDSDAAIQSRDPGAMSDTIVLGTRHVLDFARHANAKRFLLTSSGAVYGPQPRNLTHIPETFAGTPDPIDVRSAYGLAKQLAEQTCAHYHQSYGIQCVIARCFAFVGPHLPLDQHFAIGNFIRDGLAGGPIRVGGDGTPYRSYLYAADLAAWLWRLLLDGQSGQAYNVGSDFDLTIAQLASAVAKHFGTTVTIAQAANPAVPPARYVPAIERARNELGLAPWLSLEDAIARTARFHARPSNSPAQS